MLGHDRVLEEIGLENTRAASIQRVLEEFRFEVDERPCE